MLVTIAICTKNRATHLSRTLDTLLNLRRPDSVLTEILVCDNNSTDNTQQVVRSNAEARLLFEPSPGKCYALMRVIREARGEWLFFVDDDVTVPDDWLLGYFEAMRTHPQASFFGGRVLPQDGTAFSGMAAYILSRVPGACGVVTTEQDVRLKWDTTLDFGGANMAFRRDALTHPSAIRLLREFAERRVCCEDTALMLDHVGRGEEGWLLVGPTVRHHIAAERPTLTWLWHWSYHRGRSFRRTPKGVPPGPSLIRVSLLKRLRLFRDQLIRADPGAALLFLVAILAVCAGFVLETRRPH